MNDNAIKWDIRLDGRSWKGDEGYNKLKLITANIEMYHGKAFISQKQRLMMLGMLLENVGIRKAIRFGDIELWKKAVSEFEADYA